ncbi:MAG: chorismate-binding protein [Saprospiraceae bacterium]|nr:MAG: chorismate-binding protein [Bacteroidetes bacterium OLB9]MCO6463379.1 chorismate-binding protein [Saprospiraceae bacterium]
MNDIIITITRILFEKNIPFVVYRFPYEQRYHLAIGQEQLSHNPDKFFWMAPFCALSEAKDVYWGIVRDEDINPKLIDYIKSLSPQPEVYALALPQETTREQYFDRIEAYLTEIRSGKLDKAILSRVVYEDRLPEFDPVDTFTTLTEDYPNTFVHLSLHPDSGIWMGATPELLLEKQDEAISIMALAGTQARQDGSEYSWRAKEMEEHLMVGQHIEEVFSEFDCVMEEKIGPHTLVAGRVAHLATDYRFKEQGTLHLKEFLKVLHPTPAVGGLPADKGIGCILEHEGYDRKYYCGFVGETDFVSMANLYINLRNVQIGQDKIAIFVGGGITSSSNPDEEWNETIMKSKTMIEKL